MRLRGALRESEEVGILVADLGSEKQLCGSGSKRREDGK